MILSAILLALLWGMAIVRFPTLFRDTRQRALWASLAAVTLGKTFAFPPILAGTGAPALPHLCGVLAAFFLLRFVALVTGRGDNRQQTALAIGVLAALIIIAATGTAPAPRVPTRHFAYWVILEGYLAYVLVNATTLFWSTSRQVGPGLPRFALRMMAVGTAMITVFAVFRVSALLAEDLRTVEPIAEQIQTVAVLLTVTGGMLAASPRARSALTAYRNLLVLRPLWKAMRDTFPEIILFTPRRAIVELAGVDDIHLRLYRRVIEIRDGMLALRPYLERPEPGADETANSEADAIVRALERRKAGEPPSKSSAEAAWAPVGSTLADEVAWLSAVSRAYRRSGVRTPTPSGSAR
ncbi:MAB_1171c family putative transporter [Actinoplanes sp. NPDC048796]|uniref:MAB_1171c family putative transporter n=1 Tax=unclassified Actinoplanes TaxID=2626549 RepID=UPI0033F92BDA